MLTSGVDAREVNAGNRMRAALVTRRPVRPIPVTTASGVDPVSS